MEPHSFDIALTNNTENYKHDCHKVIKMFKVAVKKTITMYKY